MTHVLCSHANLPVKGKMMKHFPITPATGRRLPALCFCAVASWLAGPPALGKPVINELSDSQMATIHGKYAGYGQILYFGVEMLSQWQTQDGRTYEAGINLSVDTATLQPTITLVNNVSAGQAPGIAAPATTTRVDGSGLQNVSGVAQGIQIGGDGNTVRNDIAMNVGAAAKGAATGQLATASGQYLVSSPGATTTFQVAPGGLTVALNVAGQGQLSQSLRSGYGLQQFVQVTGDQNQIHNSLRISASMPGSFSQPGRLSQSVLDTLKGLQTGH
jgi:hypothetical protein